MADRGCAVSAVVIFFQFFNLIILLYHGGMRWRALAACGGGGSKFFFKFCNAMICCFGCTNDGVAAMVVVAAEKFQKFSKRASLLGNEETHLVHCC